jgi:flagellar basal body-associated protein FliL
MRVNRILVIAIAATLCVGPALAAGNGGSSSSGSGGGDDAQAPASRQERLTSANSWLPMPTLSACILTRESTDGTIIVDLGIDVPDAALRQRANANGPRIRDALLTALSTYANVYYRTHTEPDPDTITRLLQRAVDQTLRAQGSRVLLVNVVYQRRQSL